MDPALGAGEIAVPSSLPPLPGARLDLSENLVLLLYPGGIAVADQRPPHECGDGPCWTWQPEGSETGYALYALLEARARKPDAEWEKPEAIRPEPVHQAYGNRVLQAHVRFGEGLEEDWTLRVDPLQVGFDWIRQPHAMGDQCAFRIITPALSHGLQFWQADTGLQSMRCSNGMVEDAPSHGAVAGTALLYCDLPRAALRIQTVAPGQVSIATQSDAPHGVHTHRDHAGSWVADWEVLHGQLIHMSGNLGFADASRRFMAPALGAFADASADFGPFYLQALLGGAGLLDDPAGLPRSTALGAAGDCHPAGMDELALAAEALGSCAPQWMAAQLRRALDNYLSLPSSMPLTSGLDLFQETKPAFALLMAGRYLRITGDVEYIAAHAPALRESAEGLLALRRRGEALPAFLDTEKGFHVKQPGSTAVLSAALFRCSAMEERLGDAENSKRFAEAAMAMQWAALAPMQTGGLWHLGRGTFARYVNAEGYPEGMDPEDAPGAEFDFGQQLLAFWLGLCEDDDTIRRCYEYVDYTYTYATGRGGPVYPPGYRRSFHALIDVAVRARHACGDIEAIFQRVLDCGGRYGLPFSQNLRGEALPAGALLDNAPYFELVLRHHYGLDYDAGGWRLFTPRPLANYPLTRVTNLRHRNALYGITWQGRGAIQRVTINGAPHPTRVLDKTTGEHEVVVTLG